MNFVRLQTTETVASNHNSNMYV